MLHETGGHACTIYMRLAATQVQFIHIRLAAIRMQTLHACTRSQLPAKPQVFCKHAVRTMIWIKKLRRHWKIWESMWHMCLLRPIINSMHGPIQSRETVPQGGLGGFWTYILLLWKAQTPQEKSNPDIEFIFLCEHKWISNNKDTCIWYSSDLICSACKMASQETIHLGSKGADSETKHSFVFSLQLWSKWKA